MFSVAYADNPKVNMNTFRPSVHGGDILGVQTALMPKQWAWGVGGYFLFQQDSLALIDATTEDKIYQIIHNDFMMDVMGNVSLFDFLNIGISVPVHLFAKGDTPPAGYSLLFDRVEGTSLGDIRLGIKGAILRSNGGGFGLGLSEEVTFPTATTANLLGDDGVTSTTRVLADFVWSGFHAGVNVGVKLKKKVSLPGHDISHQLLYSAGLAIPILCGNLEIVGTLEGWTSLTKPFESKYDNGLDLFGGVRTKIGPIALLAGGGGGVLKGYGSPAFRVGLSAFYESDKPDKGCVKDRDKDGIEDAVDKCPDEPGPKETEGCPDRDHDGIADRSDRCPDQPGSINLKGCPDKDKDGIADIDDECPEKPGLPKFKGCPDRDNDGIVDDKDRCPDDPGPVEHQGCPDRDGDKVVDIDDKCPDEPGEVERNGCPAPKAVLTEKKIEILEVVHFETDKAIIKPESYGLLRDVAKILKEHPEIKLVEVQGHTDNKGGKAYNMKLSQKRAEAVRDFLIKEGIELDRLTAKGFGPTKPVADNKTEEGRAKNRRVEFVIIKKL